VNFALYSQHASAVFLLLFDVADGGHEVAIDPPDHYIVNAQRRHAARSIASPRRAP
jgi:hypothetical protein